jgi:hypothetical protein
MLWSQAKDTWGDGFETRFTYLVSVGTGVPNLAPVRDDILNILTTLKAIATETEKTAERFHRDKSHLDDQGRFYRFNVEHGLENIGLEEYEKKRNEIAAATGRYLAYQAVYGKMKACAKCLSGVKC